MNRVRTFSRLVAPLSLVFLAACQAPGQKTAQAPAAASASTPPAAQQQQAPDGTQRQGAPVAVFLASATAQKDWRAIDIPDGKLYVNPQPVITRADLAGVQGGTNKAGEGVLVLGLNSEGQRKIVDVTTKNPGKRLALVVGRTLMAAPQFASPVRTDNLFFVVGTGENANAAARAIAGVPDDGSAGAAGAAPQQPATGTRVPAPRR